MVFNNSFVVMERVIIFFLGCLYLASGISENELGVPRIVGGTPANIEDHPWQVSIQIFGKHLCGGSIISPDSIVTAAHCINRSLIKEYYVVPGITDLREVNETYPIKKAIIHNCYNHRTYDYDIAILKLETALSFSETIQSIKLPNKPSVIPDGTPVTVSGWGSTENFPKIRPIFGSTVSLQYGAYSDVLREVVVKYINWYRCYNMLAHRYSLTRRMICAGDRGKDACQADSGGALELNGTLIGIVSWGHLCGHPNYPGVYTNVRDLRFWIRRNANIPLNGCR